MPTDLTEVQSSLPVKLAGGDEQYFADVDLVDGKKRLLTTGLVQIENLLGSDPFPDTYFTIDNAGASGNTIRVQVAATTADPSTPDRDAPAVDVTITVTAAEAGDEMKMRDKVVDALNADLNFSASLKANKPKDNAVVHITSKYRGPFWERPNVGDVMVTTTGAVVVSLAFDKLLARGKSTSLARDPDSPHKLGILGIAGTVSVVPGSIANQFIQTLKNAGSDNLLVNGSITPVEFILNADPVFDLFITQLRIGAQANGIKFGQFLSTSSLTNGVLLEIRSDGQIFQFPAFKTTEDIKTFLCKGADQFILNVQSAKDDLTATFIPDASIPIRKQGTISGGDDYIKIIVRDNLTTSSLQLLRTVAFGFKKEV